jgi:aspartyl protease family protein
MRLRRAALALGCLLLAGPAGSEIYRWTDEQGREHFTQNLSQVPPRFRRKAEERAHDGGSAGPSNFQTYSSEPVAAGGDAPASVSRDGGEEVYRVRVARAGTGMLVEVRLNGSVTAPFLIDTGASDVLVPESVAAQLGLDTGAAARTKRYSTANGVVEHPVVMLRSVALGGAVVENVPASVSPNMDVGLLGLSFFNHFTYNVDAAEGIVTLRRNRLASSGGIRGGRSEAQWRSEFAALHHRIGTVEAEHDGKSEAKSRERERLQEELSELRRQLDLLEDEADHAHVPMGWRH